MAYSSPFDENDLFVRKAREALLAKMSGGPTGPTGGPSRGNPSPMPDIPDGSRVPGGTVLPGGGIAYGSNRDLIDRESQLNSPMKYGVRGFSGRGEEEFDRPPDPETPPTDGTAPPDWEGWQGWRDKTNDGPFKVGMPSQVREGTVDLNFGPERTDGTDTSTTPPATTTTPPAGTSPTAGQYRGSLQGFDEGKFNNPEHNTPKYVFARIAQDYPPTPEGMQQMAKDPRFTAAGFTVIGDDKIQLPDGEVIDVGLSFSAGGGVGWAWQPGAGAGDAGAGAGAGGGTTGGGAHGNAASVDPYMTGGANSGLDPLISGVDPTQAILEEIEALRQGKPSPATRRGLLKKMSGGH